MKSNATAMNTWHIPNEEPMNSSAVLARLARHPQCALVVACNAGRTSPDLEERTTFFAERGSRLKPLLDGWLAPGVRDEVIAALSATIQVSSGFCSSPHVHSASLVWANHGGELRLWRRRSLVARFKPGETELRWFQFGPWRRFANSHFSCTHGFLSSSWLWRGVRLQRRDESVLPIIHSLDPIVLFDPTYQGPDLTRDAGWVGDLARAISQVTALPLKLDSPLA